MSDFDEYFPDELVLDEITLAALDAEERKFRESQQYRKPASLPLPPPKRQKTAEGWNHAGNSGTQSDSFYDDLPEISVGHDGSYGLLGGSTAQSTQKNIPRKQTIPYSAALSQSRLNPRNAAPVPIRHESHSNPRLQRRPGSFNSSQVVSQRAIRNHNAERPINDEVAALRLQLEQLTKSHNDTVQALSSAQEVRFAKEGEVSILRKTMEKTVKEHNADIVNLRTAKETAEAMQLQVQKEMKEEIERMRIQFSFKQHELEASVRKPSWSRGWKAPIDPSLTPSNRNHSELFSDEQRIVRTTPYRPQIDPVVRGSPDASRTVQPSQTKNPPKTLPGFVNAFQQSSPSKSQKAHRPAPLVHEVAADDAKSTRPIAKSMLGRFPNNSSPPSSPTASQYDAMDVGIEEGVDMELIDENNAEDMDETEPLDWGAEIHHIIFTHASPFNSDPTVQTLTSVTFPASVSESEVDAFSSASAELWTILSSITTFHQLQLNHYLLRISECLVKMAKVLNTLNSIPALAAVLGLLKILTYFISPFCNMLLSIREGEDNQESLVVIVLCDVVLCQITLPGTTSSKLGKRVLGPDLTNLAEETLGLFEALCWNVPEGLETRLVKFIRTEGILNTLLDVRQPSWLLYRTVRSLVFFAGKAGLSRYILTCSESENRENNDYSRIPHMERLYGYLADDDGKSAEDEMTRNGILTLISTVYITYADARMILLESETLIPSLVARLTHLTNLLWQDDERLMCSPELTNETSRSLCQTLYLLYDLVFNAQPQVDLKQKIQNTNRSAGIDHMFNVTFGRLAYAPDLTWVPAETSKQLSQVAETAIDILRLVVDSAEEEEMIYVAYQEDDEEREAMQLEANDL